MLNLTSRWYNTCDTNGEVLHLEGGEADAKEFVAENPLYHLELSALRSSVYDATRA